MRWPGRRNSSNTSTSNTTRNGNRTSTRGATALRWAASVVAALCSAALFWGFHSAHQLAQQKRQWPQRMAVVADTAVLRAALALEEAAGHSHCAHSTVQYQWRGQVLTALLQRGELLCGVEHAVHLAAHEWPRGREVLVHVNPARPTEVLHAADIDLTGLEYLLLVAGCLLALVPIGFFCEPARTGPQSG
jgi:hypothetical protein